MKTKSGNVAKNQDIISDSSGQTFVSYGTKIAHKSVDGRVTLDETYWDYSATTGYYRNQFLGEGISETRKKIASGEYTLESLNN